MSTRSTGWPRLLQATRLGEPFAGEGFSEAWEERPDSSATSYAQVRQSLIRFAERAAQPDA